MGARFLTERKIEDYLVEEVRALPMPDGTVRHVRAFRLRWRNYDIVLQHGALSAVELSALTLFYATKTGLPFEEALADVLGPLRVHANAIIDQKLAWLNRPRGTPKKDS